MLISPSKRVARSFLPALLVSIIFLAMTTQSAYAFTEGVPFTVGDASSTVPYLIVDTTGDVGVGTTTSIANLGVNGNLWVTNNGATSYSVFGNATFGTGALTNGTDFFAVSTTSVSTGGVRAATVTALYNGGTDNITVQGLNVAAILGSGATTNESAVGTSERRSAQSILGSQLERWI